MISIVTSRTRRLYTRPPGGPWTLNWGSPQANGLVTFLPFNSGNINDLRDMAKGLQVTINGGGTFSKVAGPDGGYASLGSGSATDYRISSYPYTAIPLTFAAWGRPANTSSNYFFMQLCADSANKIQLYWNAGNVYLNHNGQVASSSKAYVANEWSLATATMVSSTLRSAYLNGNYKGTNTNSVSAPTITDLEINGDRLAGGFGSFNCPFCHVCVWNRALSDAEVYALYDPVTRWDLYYPLGRKTWGFLSAGGGKGMTFVRQRARTLRRM